MPKKISFEFLLNTPTSIARRVQRSRGAKQRSNFKKSKSINRVIDYFYTCITNVMVADINGNQENSLENQENVLNTIQLIFII